MHIGLVIYGSLETQSGGYLYDRKLMEYLRAQGHTIEIVSLAWRGYWRHVRDNFSADLRQHLLTANFDILIQDELNHPSLVLLNQQLQNQLPYPCLTLVHHLRCSEKRPRWQNRFYRQIEKQYLKTVDGYIFNSDTTRSEVEKLIGTAQPHTIAFPAADHLPEQDDPLNLPEKILRNAPIRLLFVGNVIPRKGLHTLLRSLDHVPPQRWKLDIIGSLETNLYYALAMQRIVAQSPWKDNVRFWGTVSEQELTDRYKAAHLLIMPSEYEGFGIVYLEAMSYGVLPIGSTAGAAHEIISHDQNGYLIDHKDHHTLAELINRLHQDRPHLLQLSQKARARYELHPTWKQTCEQIHQFLLTQVESMKDEV